MMNKLFERGLHRIKEARFTLQARGVLDTPPLSTSGDDGLIIFSMIGTRVIVPYLVAAKSLYSQLGRGRFVILDDGSLTPADRDVLAHHLDNPPVLSIADIDSAPAPRGGCWERLFALLDLRRDAYVIQLDSDTVTLGPVPEIEAAIAAGRDFTLRGEAGSEWQPIGSFGSSVPVAADAHVQRAIEAVMDKAGAAMPAFSHYVRGCAGFAGFAPGGLGRDTCEQFCAVAASLIGADRWAQWGSEQVMSNLLVANEGEPVLLPYDRYLNYWAEPFGQDAAFVHFVGTYRFHAGTYARAARRAIAAMR